MCKHEPVYDDEYDPSDETYDKAYGSCGPHKTEVTKLADHVYAMWLKGYMSLVVIGDTEVLLTEPANSIRTIILKDEIAKLTDKPVTKIVLSHEHRDHTGGTEVFKDAQIIAHQHVRAFFGRDRDPIGLTPETIHVTFDREFTIDMGTTRMVLKYMGASEGFGNIVIHLPKERIVATVDLYTGYRGQLALTQGSFLDDTNMVGVRNILNEIATWDIKYAVDAHSAAMTPEMLRLNAKYFDDLYHAVLLPLQAAIEEEGSNSHTARVWNMVRYDLPASIELPQYRDCVYYDQLPDHVRRMGMSIAF